MSEATWQSIPLLTRDDVQAAGQQLYCTPMRTDHGQITQTLTSGSTGTPVATLGTTLTRMMWSVCSLRQHLWAKRDLEGKLAAIRACQPGSEEETDNWATP